MRGEPRGVPVLAIQTYIAEGARVMNAEQRAAGVVRRGCVPWHIVIAIHQLGARSGFEYVALGVKSFVSY